MKMDDYMDYSFGRTEVNRLLKEKGVNGVSFDPYSPHDAYGKMYEEYQETCEELKDIDRLLARFRVAANKNGSIERMEMLAEAIREAAYRTAKEAIQVAAQAQRTMNSCDNLTGKFQFYPKTEEDRRILQDEPKDKKGIPEEIFEALENEQIYEFLRTLGLDRRKSV